MGGPGAPSGARSASGRNTQADLRARIFVAVPALVVLVAAIVVGGAFFAALVGLLGAVCLHELYTMFERRRPIKLVGYLALIGLVLAALLGSTEEVLLVVVATLPVLFVLVLARPGSGERTLSMAVTLLGVWWIGLAVAHAVLLRELPHGAGVIVDVLVGTFVGDTAAYIGGRSLGRHALAPSISPGKTREGLLCGVLAAIAGVFVAGLFQGWLSNGDALVLGAAVALVAPLGDLFESAIKRDAGRKDTGRMFGAHGGALDRVDAALFAVVAGYWVWRALG